jgi:hypothetical protein
LCTLFFSKCAAAGFVVWKISTWRGGGGYHFEKDKIALDNNLPKQIVTIQSVQMHYFFDVYYDYIAMKEFF